MCSIPRPPNHELPGDFEPPSDSALRIAFYNLENLFDTVDDPDTQDESFTPLGSHRWNEKRLRRKLLEHAQTLRAMGGWNGLGLIGFAEVEHEELLQKLSVQLPLRSFGYRALHFESDDPRGIDVGVLWDPRRLDLDTTACFDVPLSHNERPLRSFLWARFLWNSNAFHIIIVHWPSRFGGQLKTEPKRIQAAHKANEVHEWIRLTFGNEPIILIGDFNDGPNNSSIQDGLGLRGDSSRWIFHSPLPNGYLGTHVHEGRWNLLDQCYLSLNPNTSERRLRFDSLHIFSAAWLLEESEQGQIIPFRTYRGPSYHGGVSDHLPIYFDLIQSKQD